MKTFLLLIIGILTIKSVIAQNTPDISEIKWGSDLKIHITFSNDSSSIHDITALYHIPRGGFESEEITYYPVKLDSTFVKGLLSKKIGPNDESRLPSENQAKNITLWSAIHSNIGGGYIHFINCLIYTFQTGQLSLTAPLMQRIKTGWKPNPPTESYLRTKNWDYYAPVTQKQAQKEFLLKKEHGKLGDLALLPPSMVQLFLTTNQKGYNSLLKSKGAHSLAIIDMIRLLTASNYLGKEQIDYIQNAVVKAIMQYNANQTPSVIIFDDFNAAAAISLTSEGYRIEKIIFNSDEVLSPGEKDSRIKMMEETIRHINDVNKKVFEQHLKNYYKG